MSRPGIATMGTPFCPPRRTGWVALVVVLLTGVPVFAGLTLFGTAVLYAAEGHLGGLGGVM